MEAKELDFSGYMQKRLSPEQIENSTNMVEDAELQREAMDLLETCFHYYSNLQEFREEAQRYEDYYNGDQYGDIVEDPISGEYITEGQHIANQGQVPMKQNQLRQVIKNLLGQYRDSDNKSVVVSRNKESAKAGEMFTNALHYCLQTNQAKELDVRQFEEFLISGFFMWKAYYGMHYERNIDDAIIDTVHRNRMGFNTGISDIRNKDIHTIFELLDVTIEDVIAQFAENEADEEVIRGWYGKKSTRRPQMLSQWQGDQGEETVDFYNTYDDRCRVYEIWEQRTERVVLVHDKMEADYYETDMEVEDIEAMNIERIEAALAAGVPPENIPSIEIEAKEEYHKIWYFWFLTPNGNILKHGRTPYDHEGHPYTIGLYPLVGGKIYGLIHDIIDQQKNINMMMTLMRFMIGASAKGVLLFPEDMLPDGWDMEDVSAEWTSYNGVIPYKIDKNAPNALPQQVVANSRNAGAMDVLQMQLGLLEKISGVTDAIQGHSPSSGTPSSLYAQQTHNASLSNKDFFEFFFSKKKLRDFKIVKLIQQFYDDNRYIAVGGKDYEEDRAYYDPALAKDVEFEMSMSSIASSTLYRQILDDYLMKFLETGMITFDEFLENTNMPFADKLKESRERLKSEIAAREANGERANPEVMQMFNQMLGQQG